MRTREGAYPQAIVAGISVLAVAGCGGGATTDERAIQSVYERVWTAIAARDGEGACAAMTARLRRLTAENFTGSQGGGCARAMAIFAPSSARRARPLTAIAVAGDGATATTEQDGFGRSEVRFKREGDGWKLDR